MQNIWHCQEERVAVFFFYVLFSALPDETAKLIVCVAYNVIRLTDIPRSQLVSSVKALGIKHAPKEKNSFVKVLAEELVKRNYVNIIGDKKNVSRDDKNVEAILILLLKCLFPLHSINFIIVCSVSLFLPLNLLCTWHTNECNPTNRHTQKSVSFFSQSYGYEKKRTVWLRLLQKN